MSARVTTHTLSAQRNQIEMRTLVSSVAVPDYLAELVEFMQDGKCLVFVDTNVIAWSFRLNQRARTELVQWLYRMAQDERLMIPAWAVHEYNHHLEKQDANFFHPGKAVTKRVLSALAELEPIAELGIDDGFATDVGHGSRVAALDELAAASAVVGKFAKRLGQVDDDLRRALFDQWEELVRRAGLKTDVHALAARAHDEANARFLNRLAPGFEDADKPVNRAGDLIVWNEILSCCRERKAKRAVLLTNDGKADWVYTPRSVVLPNGKAVDGTREVAQVVKLPKADLLDEFDRATGGGVLRIFSLETVADAMSSSELNSRDAADFRHLALATQVDLARTPFEAVVQWFLNHPDRYKEALDGVCRWRESPSEVDQDAFATWTAERIEKLKKDQVEWSNVLVELFL